MENIQKKFQIIFGNKSDVGKVRQKNEDYMESFQCDFGDTFIVCDGMGGHIGGEIASRLAILAIKEFMISNPKGITNTRDLINESLNIANNAIISRIEENPDLAGMGTTCVILIIKNGVAFTGNLGDSRIYTIRNKKIYQLTKDQSFVQELVDNKIITYEEAENHPRKNEIMQALGINKKITPQLNNGLSVYKDDCFVLCSDGLSGMMSDEDILKAVLNYLPMDACESLVKLANTNGGTDNITVQIIKVIEGETLPGEVLNTPPAGALDKYFEENRNEKFEKTRELSRPLQNITPQQSKSGVGKFIIVIIIAIIILAGLFSIYWFLIRNSQKQDETVEKSTQGNIEATETQDIKDIRLRLQNFLKEILFKGSLLDKGVNTPKDILMKNISFSLEKDVPPKIITYSQLQDEIISKDLWIISNFKPAKNSGNNFEYIFEVNQKSSKSYQLKITIEKLENNNILVKEIMYYTPPQPVEQKTEPQQKPNIKKGEKGESEKENKIEITLPDIKIPVPGEKQKEPGDKTEQKKKEEKPSGTEGNDPK
jgi:serine/threonine protein phosphatase PrpC